MSNKILMDRQIDTLFLSNEKRESVRLFVIHQLTNFYGITNDDISYINKYFDETISRTLYCFSHIKNKYFSTDNINALHSGQYFIFLYYLANTIYRHEIKDSKDYLDYNTIVRATCDKIYCLNKSTSTCNVYYEIEMPDYFFVDHPMASVIGRAKIGNGFSFIQGCTVGGNGGVYPKLGNNVFMYSNSKILGNSHIGNNVLIGANCYVKDMTIPDNVMVFGQYPNVIIKDNHNDKIHEEINAQFYFD